MARPTRLLACLTAGAIVVSGALTAGATPSANATPGTASGPAHPAISISGLTAAVAKALRGSTAKHVDYNLQLFSGAPGTGAIADGSIRHNAYRQSAPASNEKLFTSITALQSLPGGAEFRYTTSVSGTKTIGAGGVLSGDLVLVGSGDPTLSSKDLQGLAHRLYTLGLRHVTGRLVVDDSRYSHVTRAVGWKHDFVPDESGTVDAFTVDNNSWRGGASFEQDPTPDNAARWRAILNKAHITIAGKTAVQRAPASLTRLVYHQSEDLAALLDDTLTNSVNFNMEMVLRELGAQKSTAHHPVLGTIASGLAVVKADARLLGLPFGTVHDGSGLSYDDRQTPATITAWLTKLATEPYYLTEYYALPLSCETGTLSRRLCAKRARGEVRAKTGTLDNNTALSGYINTASGHFVVFSFLVSGFSPSNYVKVRAKVDAAITAIAQR